MKMTVLYKRQDHLNLNTLNPPISINKWLEICLKLKMNSTNSLKTVTRENHIFCSEQEIKMERLASV